MKFIAILTVISVLFLLSCEKEEPTVTITAEENWEEVERPANFRSSTYQQVINYSGSSIHAPDQTIAGNFTIGDVTDGASGELYIDAVPVQNIQMDISQSHLDEIDVYRTSENSYTYTNIFEGQSVSLNNVIETEDHLTGQLVTDAGTIDIEVDLISTARVPIPVLIWAIAGAASAATTAISCAVMRATAQSGCQNMYQDCLSTCTAQQCTYKYVSGLCGGSCEVVCIR